MATQTLNFQSPVAGTGAASNAQPMPQSSTLQKDPSTGMFAYPQSSQGNVNTGDPYSRFNLNVASILTQIQNAQTRGDTTLGGAKDALTTQSVTSTPYDKTMTPDANISAIGNAPSAFAPAITSIATQGEVTDRQLSNLKGDLSTMADIFKPTAVSPGQSLATPQGQVVLRTPNYQAPIIRPDTGNLDSWDASNAMWKSDEDKQGGTALPGSPAPGGTSAKANSTVAGVDLSKYASDPQYADKVRGIYNTISSVSTTPSADSLDAYIAGHAKGASVTGQMIMQVAQHYGLDPNLMAAQLALESHFGTIGEAPKNNNPGGVIWANQANATQGSPRPANEGGFYAHFKTPLDGLFAMGDSMSSGKASATVTSGGSAPASQQTAPKADPKGNVFSPQSQTRVAQLPPAIQKYVLAGPAGVAYINGDAAKSGGADQAAQIFAAKSGIPVLSGNDPDIMKNINDLAQQMQSMKQLVNENLGSQNDNSTLGHLSNWVGASVNNISQNKPALAKFNTYIGGVTSAATNLKTLAGGSGSGLRITGYELGSVGDSLPLLTDSWQVANAKIDAINLKISQSMHSMFPDVDPNSVIMPQSQTPSSGGTGNGALNTTSTNILDKYGVKH